MELLAALDAAGNEFRRRLVAVTADQWGNPTPCDGWDVRFLAAHVVGGNQFAALVLAGATSQTAMASVLSDTMLGPNPLSSYDASVSRQRRGFCRPGALSAGVDLPDGNVPGSRFLAMRIFDVAVHAWDLARAIGGDEQLDSELAQVVVDLLDAMPGGPGFGIVPIGATDAGDSPQEQLLDRSGRR